MKQEHWFTRFAKASVLSALVIAVSLLVLPRLFLVVAQDNGPVLPDETLATNPKDRSLEVTATVPVFAPPPVPILISPNNNAVIRERETTFEWEIQEHLGPYDYLDFSVDGEVLFSHLPFWSYETADYLLTVNHLDFRLKLKTPHALNDGLHTWKVRVIDKANRGTDSSTWSFTVDSQSPTILITEIDGEEVAISSADGTTMPEEPLVVTSAQPTINGKTEPSIEVQLVITRPGWEDKVLITKSDENGNFSFELPWLNQNEIVALRFTTVDKAGNAAVLEGLMIVYKIPKVTVTIPAGIFPDPFVLEFPSLPDFWTWTSIQLPPPVAKIVEPIIEPVIQPTIHFTDYVAQFVHDYQGMLIFLWLIFWWLYFVLLYAQTGNPWKAWFHFMKIWFIALIRGWPEHPYLWREDETGLPLPLLHFSIEVLNQTKQMEKRSRFTALNGSWFEPIEAKELYSLQCPNRRYAYPTWRLKVSEERDGTVRSLFLSGESWYAQETDAKKVTTADTFVIPELKNLCLIAWLRKSKPAPWKGWRFTPRLSLLVSLLLALILLFFATKFVYLILLILVLIVLFRDLAWNVPEKWRGYFV